MMSRGSVISIVWKPIENVNETEVPLLLRFTLYVLRLLGAAPAQLRRVRSGWWLGDSPSSLAILQRLIIIVTNILTLSALILDFQLPKDHRVRMGRTALAGCLTIAEICIIIPMYTIGVLTVKKHVKQLIATLQQLQKIKTNLLHGKKEIKKNKLNYLVTFYIAWTATTQLIAACELIYAGTKYENKSRLVNWLWTVLFYQYLVIVILQLQWSITLVEINSVLTLINDELEHIYENPELRQPGFKSTRTRPLSHNYNVISDMLKQQVNNNGPFLLMYFLLLFIHFPISLYNLIVGIEAKRLLLIVEQVNWTFQHIFKLVTLVEPCHWLQEQKGRTKRLLSGLAREMNSQQLVPAQLKLFLVQIQMTDFTMAPCYVFNISRPLLASIIGGVVTYLIVMVQLQSTRELI